MGWTLSAVAAGPKAASKLPPDQLRKVNRLLADFRRANSDLPKREAICQQVCDIGPAAVPLMAAAIEKELQPQLRRYTGSFQQQAAAVAKKRTAKVDINEVAQLRKTVLGLQYRGADFTKETIVRDGDPALKRLEQICVIDRSKVLEQSADLQAERKKLQGLGKLWESCQSQMPKPPVPEGQETPKAASFEEYLLGEEGFAAALAAPMDPKTRNVLMFNARLAEKLDREEARTILACNLMRNLLGLSALVIDPKLCEACRDHSKDMETLKFFAHESPVEGKKTPWDRAKRFGTIASAENIFMGLRDGKAANEGWFHSPGHHKNMLAADHVRIGVGRSGVYFTEEFGN
jgi:uncharacterized protein YkwD